MALNHRLFQKNHFWLRGGLLVVLFLYFPWLHPAPIFQIHTLDKEQGLLSSVVYDIAQDSDGFVWFATEDGLQKYDGVKFVNYRFNRLNPNSLSNNVVRNLLVDKDGKLWVGTNGGLNLYQKKYDNFKRFTAIEGSNNVLDKKEHSEGVLDKNELDEKGLDEKGLGEKGLGEKISSSNRLSADQIRALYQTRDGMIWVGTAAGLSRLDPHSLSIVNYSQTRVRSIFEDDHNQLWVGTLGSGLFLFDRIMKQFFPLNTSQSKTGKIDLSQSSIIDIYQDSYARIFIATWGQGVHLLHRDSQTLSYYDLALPSLNVRSIHEDESGQIWFGTEGGILVSDILKNKQRVITSSASLVSSLKSNKITKIFQASDQTVWIATNGGGAAKHFPASRKFEFYGVNKDPTLGLQDPAVFAMHENKKGDVWIGTETGKLTKFLPQSRSFESYSLPTLEGGLVENSILAIYQVSDDLLLLGTDTGLYKYFIKSARLVAVLDQDKRHINDGDSAQLIKTDLNGRLWVGFSASGLQAFKVSNNGMELRLLPDLTLEIGYPRDLLSVSENKFLVGTQGNGLFEVDLSGHEKTIRLIPLSENINVLSLALDWKGQIWAGTWSKGITIFSKNNKVTNFGEEEGLPNNTIYSILADNATHKMWISSNLGAASIEPGNLSVTRYRSADGLQSDEFNQPGFVSKNHYIYFGGINGFNRFYPNIVERKLYLSPPVVVSLAIANKEVEISQEKNAILEESLLMTKTINLEYNQTPFSLAFSSPQFAKPKDIEFRYRLLGLDDRWIAALPGSRRATYTNIDPGEYTFELQVRDINSVWGSFVERKNIIVHPPFWFSPLAKAVYWLVASLLLGTLFYFYRNRHRLNQLMQHKLEESEKRLKLSLWGGGNEIWDWDLLNGKVLRSDADKNISIDVSYLSKNLKELADYIHCSDVVRVKRLLRLHLQGQSEIFETTYRIKDDKIGWRWIQDRAKVVERDENNEPVRMSGTQRDVSDAHRKDEEIERLSQAFRTTSDGVWIRDSQWKLIECNPSYEKITGFSMAEKEGEILWFPDTDEQPANVIHRIHQSLIEKGNWQGEVWAERKNNPPFPQKLTVDSIVDDKGNTRYYVGVFSDITFHKRSEEEFRRLANFDSLTGLPNRACLYDRLNQTISKARIRKEKFAIFVVDIDNFKRVNDSLGHGVGDTLIVEVAKRLVDCNPKSETIARVGGDEFVIIRDNIRTAAEVASFAEAMLKELNLPIHIKGQKLNLNFSIGITLSPADGIAAERLMRNADTAMYEAKKEVANSYHFYSIELNQRARKRLAMENELRNAIENDSIELVYQPKVDMRTGRVCGMEALARWVHPIFGAVDPEEFISLAEETGLLSSLGRQLLRKAIEQAKKWADDGIMRGRMCVNLSAHQFWHSNLVSEISTILQEVQLDTRYFELELTESACVQDVQQTIEQMLELRKLGIHLALDDFGTGYSSLAQLKVLPLDTLKVDKTFIQNIQHSQQDNNIVKAIIDIASSLNLNVVIEGVESREQCDYLWQAKANVIQGFFFSKPVNSGQMIKLLAKKWQKSSYLSLAANNVTSIN